jgi:hypothetical protein
MVVDIAINTRYFFNNIIPICFGLYINSFTTYLYLTRNFTNQQHIVIYSIGIYELINTILELLSKKVNKELVLHHIGAVLTCGIEWWWKDSISPLLLNDMVYCQMLMISSNLYLNMQFLFPKSILAKAVFFVTYFLYRIILIFPFIKQIVQGGHYPTDILSITLQTFCVLFYLLSVYWGGKILKYALKK